MMIARFAGRCSATVCMLAVSSMAFAQGTYPTVPTAAAAPATASVAPAAEIITSTHPVFADLFRPIAGDFKRLASSRNLLFAGVGMGAAATAHVWDSRVAESTWGGSMHEALEPGQLIGNFLVQTGGALATYTIARATKHDRVASVGAHLFRAQVVSQATTQMLKVATQRTRPDGSKLSFPSGHAAAAFATASVLQSDLGWKAGVPAYAIATWVAASRVQMRRHYVSDVIAGATVGLLAGRSVTVGRGSARFALSPMVVPGGIGVTALRMSSR